MMSAELKTTVIPDRETLLSRLRKVEDNAHAIQKFYPELQRKSGSELNGMGIVLTLNLAIHDYCDGMPPVLQVLILMRMHDYIDAMTDDEEIREDAHRFWEEVQEKAGRS